MAAQQIITSSGTVNVRCMVDEAEAAVAWYTKHLGFRQLSNLAPAFADVLLGSCLVLMWRTRRNPDARDDFRRCVGA